MENRQKQLPQKHVQLHSKLMYTCEYVVSSAAVFGMSRNASPKETAAHIRLTFLSRNQPITVSVPSSRTFSRQIRPLKLVQSGNVFLSVHPVVGDVANEHADFRPLFREPKNTTTLERAEDSSKFKLLLGSVALHPKKRLRRRLMNTL